MRLKRAVRFGARLPVLFYRHYRNLDRPLVTCTISTLEKDDSRLAAELSRRDGRRRDTGYTAAFEQEFAGRNGSRFAFSFASARSALSAAIAAVGLDPGDEVLVPGYTCVVVANAFTFAGMTPVFADIELETFGLDAGQMEGRITPRTRAVLLQHLYGLVCRDYEKILAIAGKHGLKVIEDCAQATGAEFRGVKIGNRGDAAIYSSEQSKIINTIQGGLAVTNDNAIADRLREFQNTRPYPADDLVRRQLANVRLHYLQYESPHRWLVSSPAEALLGKQRLESTTEDELRGRRPPLYGQRMAPAVAALGLNQLRKMERFNEKRRQNSSRWDRWCDGHGFGRATVIPGSRPVFLRYPVLVTPEMKSEREWARRELGVEAGVWFVSNLHPSALPVSGCGNADIAVRQCINLPTLGIS